MTDDKRPLLYDPMPRKDAELPPRMPDTDTIARLTAELSEARQQRDTAVRIGAEHMARGDRLERELATALAGAVDVRPLIWERHPRGFMASAGGIGEAYIFALQSSGQYECIKGMAFTPRFDNSEAAKAAAQADYRARILPAIRALTPAAAIAAQSLRDAQMRAEGVQAGLHVAAEYLQKESAHYPDNVAWCVQDDAKAILALAAQIEGGA